MNNLLQDYDFKAETPCWNCGIKGTKKRRWKGEVYCIKCHSKIAPKMRSMKLGKFKCTYCRHKFLDYISKRKLQNAKKHYCSNHCRAKDFKGRTPILYEDAINRIYLIQPTSSKIKGKKYSHGRCYFPKCLLHKEIKIQVVGSRFKW